MFTSSHPPFLPQPRRPASGEGLVWHSVCGDPPCLDQTIARTLPAPFDFPGIIVTMGKAGILACSRIQVFPFPSQWTSAG